MLLESLPSAFSHAGHLTGMVGTALYVSPEVQGSTKSAYNQVKRQLWGKNERSREIVAGLSRSQHLGFSYQLK